MGEFAKPIHTLTLNGTNMYEHCHLYVSGSGTFKSAEKDYDVVTVPGRTGDVYLFNQRHKNREVKYPCFILDNFDENFRKLEDFLLALPYSYIRIQDTYHPDEYSMGILRGEVAAETGAFELTFSCKPQRYLLSGDTPVLVNGGLTLENPTLQPAFPFIRVRGSGDGAIRINNTVLQIHSDSSYIDIDCETQEAYCGSANKNYCIGITDKFLYLDPGSNLIQSGFTLDLAPRWYR